MANAATALPALVVGTGFGCRIQLPALRGSGFDVVGLVGADPARTAQRAKDNKVANAFTDLDEAITRTGAKLVTVATTPNTHAALTLTALKRGCHVICEKPFAMNTAEARQMRDTAQRAGVANLLGHEFRFYPWWATFAKAIADGMIGDLRFVSLVQFTGHVANSAQDLPDWWFDKEAGGGWLGAWGSHLFDLVRLCFGEVESLSAALPSLVGKDNSAEDSYALRLRFANGAEGIVQQVAASRGPALNITRAEGSKGTLWMDGVAVWFADKSGARELPVPAEFKLPPAPAASEDPRQKTARWQMLTEAELAPYTALCLALRAQIEGKPAGPIPPSTFADGVACMEILDAIRASAAEGGALLRV
jgi:predicted dehydrogenase